MLEPARGGRRAGRGATAGGLTGLGGGILFQLRWVYTLEDNTLATEISGRWSEMQQWYQCPRCGTQVAYGTRFCGNCGMQMNWPTQWTQPPPIYQQQPPREWSQQSISVPNTSGQGNQGIVPHEIEGWNWGAFLLTWIWGIGNRVWVSLLTLIPVPLLALIIAIVLGANGSKWAWQGKRWDSVEHFKKTQRTWRNWGIALAVLFIIVPSFVLGAYFIYDYFIKEVPPTLPPTAIQEVEQIELTWRISKVNA